LLNIDGTSHGLDDTGKLGQKPIAHELHDTPAAFGDLGLHQLSTEGLQALERSCLVLAHQARVADHVGGKYGGKPAFHTLSPRGLERSRHDGENPCH
jgi:hypothetical protein